MGQVVAQSRPVEFAKGDQVSWTARAGVYAITSYSRGSVTLMPVVPEPYATPEGGWITHPSKLREVDFIEVGRTAYASGDPLSPALSVPVRRALAGVSVVDGRGRKILSDFVEGWIAACMAR